MLTGSPAQFSREIQLAFLSLLFEIVRKKAATLTSTALLKVSDRQLLWFNEPPLARPDNRFSPRHQSHRKADAHF